LDHFVPDSYLEDCDVFTDDIGQFNAHFCLFRNGDEFNTLFMRHPYWKAALMQPPCLGCAGTGEHRLLATDESQMTLIMNTFHEARWKFPRYFPMHSHDRLENHKPKPKLEVKEDGSLWELLTDTGAGGGRRWPLMGREIAYFHFSTIKTWPL
jgi:hypothetical protein